MTGPVLSGTLLAIASPSKLWRPVMQGPNPHWLQENWIAIMAPKGDPVLAETFLAVEAATSDTTTSAAFPTLVAPITMQCPNESYESKKSYPYFLSASLLPVHNFRFSTLLPALLCLPLLSSRAWHYFYILPHPHGKSSSLQLTSYFYVYYS